MLRIPPSKIRLSPQDILDFVNRPVKPSAPVQPRKPNLPDLRRKSAQYKLRNAVRDGERSNSQSLVDGAEDESLPTRRTRGPIMIQTDEGTQVSSVRTPSPGGDSSGSSTPFVRSAIGSSSPIILPPLYQQTDEFRIPLGILSTEVPGEHIPLSRDPLRRSEAPEPDETTEPAPEPVAEPVLELPAGLIFNGVILPGTAAPGEPAPTFREWVFEYTG